MEYNLTINGKTIPTTVDIEEKNKITISAKEKTYNVGFIRVTTNWLHLVVNGKRVNAHIADTESGKEVVLNGNSYLIADADAIEQSMTKKEGTANTPEDITPPMPAVVVRVLVQTGDQVEKGQAVIVVSAMKMETTLYAPFAGTVTKINVAVNDKVTPEQILVEINKEGQK